MRILIQMALTWEGVRGRVWEHGVVGIHQVPGVGGVVVSTRVVGEAVIRGPGRALARIVASVHVRGQLEAGGHVAWLHEGIHRGCSGHRGGWGGFYWPGLISTHLTWGHNHWEITVTWYSSLTASSQSWKWENCTTFSWIASRIKWSNLQVQ